MKKKIIYKRPGKDPETMEVSEKYQSDLKYLIANSDTIEHCPLYPMTNGEQIMLLVDEDGHPKGLPFNFYVPVSNSSFPVQMIVGDCIFTKFKPNCLLEDDYDFRIESLTDEEIKYIHYWFQGEVQKALKYDFDKMYPDMHSYLKPIVKKLG